MNEAAVLEEQLKAIVRSDTWLMGVLKVVRSLEGIEPYVGAGAIRDVVWDRLAGKSEHDSVKDVDVIYFDSSDLKEEKDAELEAELRQRSPNENWEVTNQAGVHLWFGKRFGYSVEPLNSLREAVATWPEYATAVAVRMDERGGLDVVAPHGLRDLLNMEVRRNPTRVTVAEYRKRIERKDYATRWPSVKIFHE